MPEKVAKREKRVRPDADQKKFCRGVVKKLAAARGEEAVYVKIAAKIDVSVSTVRDYFDDNKATPTVAGKIYTECFSLNLDL